MRRSRVISFIAGCMALLCVASASAQENDIVPGQRIGWIELGMRRQVVLSKLGTPAGTYNLPGRGRGDYWFSSDNSNTLRVFYNAAGRVSQVSVTSSRFTTPEGLTTRSGLADIKRAYKNLKVLKVNAKGDIDYYYDSPRGLAFEVTDQMDAHATPVMRLYAILVFRPGAAPQPEPDEHPR